MSTIGASIAEQFRGHLLTEDSEVYHSKSPPYISSGQIKLAVKHGVEQLSDLRNGIIPGIHDRECLHFGAALHTLAGEGQEEYFRTVFISNEINPKTARSYGWATNKIQDDWHEASQENPHYKCMITLDQHQTITQMVKAMRDAPEFGHYFQGGAGLSEQTLRYTGRHLIYQIRPDLISRINPSILSCIGVSNNDVLIIDIKTIDDILNVNRCVNKFGWWYQAAFYCQIFFRVTKTYPTFAIVAVEKKPPYRCLMKVLDPRILYSISLKVQKLCNQFEEYEAQNQWPQRPAVELFNYFMS